MKAQAALVTILSLTQITELKLLLDIGRSGHRFYDFVLTLLIACISFELLVGIIIIYIGNLHYYNQSTDCCCCNNNGDSPNRRKEAGKLERSGKRRCCCCCPRNWYRRFPSKSNSSYKTVRETSAVELSATSRPMTVSPVLSTIESRLPSAFDKNLPVERSDASIEMTKVKIADAEIKIIRSTNYVKIVQEACSKSPSNPEMEAELARAKEELASAVREKEEAEAEKKLAEAQQHHAIFLEELSEDRQEKMTFRKMAFWQHMATYLLYFVMLMNVFITTFGISGGNYAPTSPISLPTPAAAPTTASTTLGN